jgi:hypothetical protein
MPELTLVWTLGAVNNVVLHAIHEDTHASAVHSTPSYLMKWVFTFAGGAKCGRASCKRQLRPTLSIQVFLPMKSLFSLPWIYVW